MLLPSMLATGVLTNLMVPSLAAFQDERERFAAAYRRAVTLVALVGCPMAVGLALTAQEAVTLIYGGKWLAVAPMVTWLSIAGITQPFYNTTGWLFTAVGKAKAYLLLTVTNAVILVAAFFLAVPYGVLAVAAAYGVVMGLLLLGPAMWWAHQCAAIKLRDTAIQLLPVFLCVAVMACAVIASGQAAAFIGLDWLWNLFIKVVVGVLVYGFCAYRFMPAHVKSEIFGIFSR
jgi:PST family polysaccharide transporter